MKRRERNRVAAAKCRQNRQNQIEDLKARRKALEDESNQTRQLLQTFRHEKQQLEELLKKHAVSHPTPSPTQLISHFVCRTRCVGRPSRRCFVRNADLYVCPTIQLTRLPSHA